MQNNTIITYMQFVTVWIHLKLAFTIRPQRTGRGQPPVFSFILSQDVITLWSNHYNVTSTVLMFPVPVISLAGLCVKACWGLHGQKQLVAGLLHGCVFVEAGSCKTGRPDLFEDNDSESHSVLKRWHCDCDLRDVMWDRTGMYTVEWLELS